MLGRPPPFASSSVGIICFAIDGGKYVSPGVNSAGTIGPPALRALRAMLTKSGLFLDAA